MRRSGKSASSQRSALYSAHKLNRPMGLPPVAPFDHLIHFIHTNQHPVIGTNLKQYNSGSGSGSGKNQNAIPIGNGGPNMLLPAQINTGDVYIDYRSSGNGAKQTQNMQNGSLEQEIVKQPSNELQVNANGEIFVGFNPILNPKSRQKERSQQKSRQGAMAKNTTTNDNSAQLYDSGSLTRGANNLHFGSIRKSQAAKSFLEGQRTSKSTRNANGQYGGSYQNSNKTSQQVTSVTGGTRSPPNGVVYTGPNNKQQISASVASSAGVQTPSQHHVAPLPYHHQNSQGLKKSGAFNRAAAVAAGVNPQRAQIGIPIVRDTASRGRQRTHVNQKTLQSKMAAHISPSPSNKESKPNSNISSGAGNTIGTNTNQQEEIIEGQKEGNGGRAGKRIIKTNEESSSAYNDVSGLLGTTTVQEVNGTIISAQQSGSNQKQGVVGKLQEQAQRLVLNQNQVIFAPKMTTKNIDQQSKSRDNTHQIQHQLQHQSKQAMANESRTSTYRRNKPVVQARITYQQKTESQKGNNIFVPSSLTQHNAHNNREKSQGSSMVKRESRQVSQDNMVNNASVDNFEATTRHNRQRQSVGHNTTSSNTTTNMANINSFVAGGGSKNLKSLDRKQNHRTTVPTQHPSAIANQKTRLMQQTKNFDELEMVNSQGFQNQKQNNEMMMTSSQHKTTQFKEYSTLSPSKGSKAPQRLSLAKIDSEKSGPVQPSSPTPQPEPSKKLVAANSTKNRDSNNVQQADLKKSQKGIPQMQSNNLVKSQTNQQSTTVGGSGLAPKIIGKSMDMDLYIQNEDLNDAYNAKRTATTTKQITNNDDHHKQQLNQESIFEQQSQHVRQGGSRKKSSPKSGKRLKASETCPEGLSPSKIMDAGISSNRVMQQQSTGKDLGKNVQKDARILNQMSTEMGRKQKVLLLNPNEKSTIINKRRKNQAQVIRSTLQSQIDRKGGVSQTGKLTENQSFVSEKRRGTISRAESHSKDLQVISDKKRDAQRLRAFREVIERRRKKQPDQQPFDLKEFQIGLQIGQGAFAIVRRATHKDSKHIVALKTYDKKNLKVEEAQMAVHREINTLSDLWHPNIMKLHEVVDQRTHVHLVMELCQGASIYHHIKKMPDQRLPEPTCKAIFKQLVHACSYLHSKGYSHRDLKLDNILFESNAKQIKIIDFGFSLKASHTEKLSVFCGTPHYMDPDLVRKQPYNGPAADVWACGVIVYILMVGKLPFFGEFEADLFRKIQSGKYSPLPADLSSNGKFKSLLRAVFEVNPNQRIRAEKLLQHPWLKDTAEICSPIPEAATSTAGKEGVSPGSQNLTSPQLKNQKNTVNGGNEPAYGNENNNSLEERQRRDDGNESEKEEVLLTTSDEVNPQ